MDLYLGIDVGSVSTNLIALDKKKKVKATIYTRTHGQPIKALTKGLNQLKKELPKWAKIVGAATTGSGRELAAALVGADVTRNEITAQAIAALHFNKKIKTVIEIGGQDSKIILFNHNTLSDFNMNTVCAAGTGSFLDQQSSRLEIKVEDFGRLALKANTEINISGRCTVFAESDMIHKQQLGYSKEEILWGLCKSLVRNYLNNVARGKKIEEPIFFQGGVAANVGIKKAFEEELGLNITIPKYFKVMGAIGAAILAMESKIKKTKFKGFEIAKNKVTTKSFQCKDCDNLCEIVEIFSGKEAVGVWGDNCEKWQKIKK
jgi:predicted CoA-substrate-specific enzyme activase